MELIIREVLEKKDTKVSSLAEMVGITRANMSNIVNGKSTPSLDTLERIANALNVDITDLFKKNDSLKDTLKIIFILLFKSIFSGILIQAIYN